jgi:Arc/MetJ family transcription regulator
VIELPVLELMPLSCYGITNNYYTRLVMRTALPLAFITVCVLVKLFGGQRHHTIADKMMSAAFFVIFLLYPTNSQKIFTTFLCIEFDDPMKTRALIADLSLDCRLATHQLYQAYALVMLIYPIGTPLLYAYLVHRLHGRTLRKMRLNEALRERLRDEALADIHHDRNLQHTQLAERSGRSSRLPPVAIPTEDDLPAAVLKRITVLEEKQRSMHESLPDYMRKLTSGYKARNADFEIYECVRKLALVCMPVWFEPGSVAQLIFGLMVCFLTFGAYTAWAPFAEERANVLAQACQVQIFFALLSAIALSFDVGKTEGSTQSIDLLLTVLTFVPLSITVLLRTPLRKYLQSAERSKLATKLRRVCCGQRAGTDESLPTNVATPPQAEPAEQENVRPAKAKQGEEKTGRDILARLEHDVDVLRRMPHIAPDSKVRVISRTHPRFDSVGSVVALHEGGADVRFDDSTVVPFTYSSFVPVGGLEMAPVAARQGSAPATSKAKLTLPAALPAPETSSAHSPGVLETFGTISERLSKSILGQAEPPAESDVAKV